MNQKSNKTHKNRKKPVETEEFILTKPLEKAKVNCGTVLRTRMNIDDRTFYRCILIDSRRGWRADPEVYFERKKE